MLRPDQNHPDRTAAQMRLEVLFGAGEEGIEVDREPFKASWFAHRNPPA